MQIINTCNEIERLYEKIEEMLAHLEDQDRPPSQANILARNIGLFALGQTRKSLPLDAASYIRQPYPEKPVFDVKIIRQHALRHSEICGELQEKLDDEYARLVAMISVMVLHLVDKNCPSKLARGFARNIGRHALGKTGWIAK